MYITFPVGLLAFHVHIFVQQHLVNIVPNTMYTATKYSVCVITAPCRKCIRPTSDFWAKAGVTVSLKAGCRLQWWPYIKLLFQRLHWSVTVVSSVRPILRIGEYSLVVLQHRRIRYISLRVSADTDAPAAITINSNRTLRLKHMVRVSASTECDYK